MAILLLLLIPFLAIFLTFISGKKVQLYEKIGFTSAILECIAIVYLVTQVVTEHTYSFLPYFSLNSLNMLILCITVVIGLFATCHGIGYFAIELKKKTIDIKKVKESYMLMRLFLLLMYIAILTANPIILWICVEATTLATVFLINFFDKPTDVEAAWKFLIINSVGLLLGLLGTLIFLTQGGSVGRIFIEWADLAKLIHQMNPDIIKFAYIFLFIGYGTKMGIVPMHTWLPDAHSQAPSPISSLLSGALINVAFLAILRFTLLTNGVVGPSFSQTLFLFFGALSVILAASIIYSQKSYKRMLAYSTIEHAGLMLLGVGFGGVGIFGSLLLMVYHGLGKALLFLLSSNIVVKYGSSMIVDIKGMIKTLPFTSTLYIFAVFFITGMPPLGMFFSEFYIYFSGFRQYMPLGVIILIMLIFVFIGFFKSVLNMVFSSPNDEVKEGEYSLWTRIPVGILAFVLLTLSIYIPPFLAQLLKESVVIIQQTQ